MEQVSIKAYAKINLGLDVVRRLPNGYHQVKMIMQTIDLSDELTLRRTRAGISIACDSGGVPLGSDNLIYKAAALLLEKYGSGSGISVHLKKNIPIAAGMAGGSTDAAAAMRGICRLFGWDIPPARLMEYGVSVGADVPYCLMGGTALAEGIGERLTPLPALQDCLILVAKPEAGISTQYVYQHLDAAGLPKHPDIDGMADSIRTGSLKGVLDRMGNVLETVTVPAFPVIDRIKNRMLELGAANSLMSGSGPSVFGIFPPGQEEAAQKAFVSLEGDGLAKQVFLVKPVSPYKDPNEPAHSFSD